MVATDKLFAESIPEIYDRFLVPLIFESYARDLAERGLAYLAGVRFLSALLAVGCAAVFWIFAARTVPPGYAGARVYV